MIMNINALFDLRCEKSNLVVSNVCTSTLRFAEGETVVIEDTTGDPEVSIYEAPGDCRPFDEDDFKALVWKYGDL